MYWSYECRTIHSRANSDQTLEADVTEVNSAEDVSIGGSPGQNPLMLVLELALLVDYNLSSSRHMAHSHCCSVHPRMHQTFEIKM